MEVQAMSCAANVHTHLADRYDDLEKLFRAYQTGDEERHTEDLGTFPEYGIGFDYIPAGTFPNQYHGYWRYLLGCGGPREEFRFYALRDMSLVSVEFALLESLDGTTVEVGGDKRRLLEDIWFFFCETGSVESEFNKAIADDICEEEVM